MLLPGLSLTTAAIEVASQHLVSGSARFAGAVAVLLKLGFGALVGSKLAAWFDWQPLAVLSLEQPLWLRVSSLLVSAAAFALLFKARIRDWWVVFLAATISYLSSRAAITEFGPELGLFVAAFVVTVLSNIYARWANRPGAISRLPGLILLVPGSVGFKSLTFVFEKDVFLGLDTAFSMVTMYRRAGRRAVAGQQRGACQAEDVIAGWRFSVGRNGARSRALRASALLPGRRATASA